jgi:rare lipoprotein A
MRAVHAALLLATASLASACAPNTAPPAMRSVDQGWYEEGEASWYGPGFHGNRTASGEVYDMEALTAAHRELPFGARVRVVNVDNGRQTQVRINDRGPFARGRVLDVSRAAARELGMIGSGTARVRIEVLQGVAEPPARTEKTETVIPARCTLVQVAAYSEQRNASEMMRRLEARGETVRQRREDGVIRVLIGPYATEQETRLALEHYDGVLRPCDP